MPVVPSLPVRGIVSSMTGPFADRLFRIAFLLAGCYNLSFGLWAALWPHAFFELLDLEPPRYPGIWACLGMVVGVYGLLYLHAAWKLETAWPIIAVGSLGKVLGPIGMALSFGNDWPRRLGMICIYNDLVWWLPFGLFLVRGSWLGRQLEKLAPWMSVAAHAVAFFAMIVLLRQGTLSESDVLVRGRYIADHAAAWSIGWSAWMLAAMSYVGFCAWWGSQLAARYLAITGVLVAAFGMVFDFSGEGLSILLLVERAATAGENAVAFSNLERSITLLTAGAANGLYTLGGFVLMLATPDLATWIRMAMWGTWLAGTAMTVAGVFNHIGGMVASTAVLFPLMIAWTAWMGARWRRA